MFSDSFGFKNPILDFLEETHPYINYKLCTVKQQVKKEHFKSFSTLFFFLIGLYLVRD